MRVALAPSYLGWAVANGVKGDDNYRGPRQKGAPCDLNRLGEASLKRRSGHLTGHMRVVTNAYHLHVFLSLASSNIQKNLKHSNTRRRKALMQWFSKCVTRTTSGTWASSSGTQRNLRMKYKSGRVSTNAIFLNCFKWERLFHAEHSGVFFLEPRI